MFAAKRLLIALFLVMLMIAIPVLYAQEGTEEAPEATAEVPEATAEVPEGTAEATDATTDGTATSTATLTTVPLPSATPTVSLTPSATLLATLTFTPTATLTFAPPTAIPGPPYSCDSTTIMLLLLAQTYGFSQSQQALPYTLADYDLGGAQAIFDAIRPRNPVVIDQVLADETTSQALQAYIQSLILEDLGLIEDIQVYNEHPSCLQLRQTLLDFLLVNILYEQFTLQNAEG